MVPQAAKLCKQIVYNIRDEFENYLILNKMSSVVLGVSGGIDSAVVAALAYPVRKKLNVKLIGRSITIASNKEDEQERAVNIGENFCTDFQTCDLTDQFKHSQLLCDINESDTYTDRDTLKNRIRYGNLKARMRMIVLYDLAQKNNGMVLSTDNLTELLMGFWTLHGDVGDYGMIQSLWKGEVYDLANYLVQSSIEEFPVEAQLALQACIDAKPTDGLGVSDSDLDQLLPGFDPKMGYREGYQEVDRIMKKYLYECGMKQFLDHKRLPDDEFKTLEGHPVVQRYLNTRYKRNNPYNISRKDLFYDTDHKVESWIYSD